MFIYDATNKQTKRNKERNKNVNDFFSPLAFPNVSHDK